MAKKNIQTIPRYLPPQTTLAIVQSGSVDYIGEIPIIQLSGKLQSTVLINAGRITTYLSGSQMKVAITPICFSHGPISHLQIKPNAIIHVSEENLGKETFASYVKDYEVFLSQRRRDEGAMISLPGEKP